MRLFRLLLLLALCYLAIWTTPGSVQGYEPESIRPWIENPFYWEYGGKPVLLIGGSDDDNLFQWLNEPLRRQLDLLKSVGGNYVRNTMSDRHDKGFEVYPFAKKDTLYDLEAWNPEYWRRFRRFLEWTKEREIFVQIEVWDRFDYSRENWKPHPYNPLNNVNYTEKESGLATAYPNHPGRNEQPFFFTTPDQRDNRLLLKFQRKFVDKLLSYSLEYPHILYCIDNETNGEEAWGRYWAEYIKKSARQKGKTVQITEMWDAWDLKSEEHRRTFDHPELYDFVDVSQNNHNKGDVHWENALWVRRYISRTPRPINTVKTYGADGNKFGHSDQDGVERFWRHLLAGFASARFHRPDSGLGLSQKAQTSIQSARKIEERVPFWNFVPEGDQLKEREIGEAYTASDLNGTYLVYFPAGGQVILPLKAGDYEVHWLSIESGNWSTAERVASTGQISLEPSGPGNWIALVTKD